jgi:hypothetical protein
MTTEHLLVVPIRREAYHQFLAAERCTMYDLQKSGPPGQKMSAVLSHFVRSRQNLENRTFFDAICDFCRYAKKNDRRFSSS